MNSLQSPHHSQARVEDKQFVCHARAHKLPFIVARKMQSLHISYNGGVLQQWALESDNGRLLLCLIDDFGDDRKALSYSATLAAIDAVFSHRQDLAYITAQANAALVQKLRFAGVMVVEAATPQSDVGIVAASTFLQLSALWLQREGTDSFPLQYVINDGKRHPQRPPKPEGAVYSRHIPWLNKTLSFHVVDISRDLLTINRWMNTPSVAEFYQESGDLDYHASYLQKQLDDDHTLPLIGFFDGIAFGYFEVYWAKEDRIAPFYDVDDFDRGWHMLVGDENFRGRPWFTAWCSSIIHFMFLDDCRTQRIVCEPRHDHPKLIRNLDQFGFARLKEFNFPHKRSMLLLLLRERFFEERMTTRYVDSNY